jgi:imidazolonepropionase-like amidohydrolase
MDPKVGDFDMADVLVDGGKIVAVGPKFGTDDAEVIDAAGMIAMPGFFDAYNHLLETAQRSCLAGAMLHHGRWSSLPKALSTRRSLNPSLRNPKGTTNKRGLTDRDTRIDRARQVIGWNVALNAELVEQHLLHHRRLAHRRRILLQ